MMTLNFSGRYALIAHLGVPSCALRYAYARVRTSSDSPDPNIMKFITLRKNISVGNEGVDSVLLAVTDRKAMHN